MYYNARQIVEPQANNLPVTSQCLPEWSTQSTFLALIPILQVFHFESPLQTYFAPYRCMMWV